MSRMHVHLEPVGGIAGDMFVAAMLDLFPDLLPACWQDLEACGVMQHVSVQCDQGWSQGLSVHRFQVTLTARDVQRTGHYADLRQYLSQSELAPAVRERALYILRLLAEAEAEVHGVDIDQVHFHEVADWDSVVDIVASASLIERSGVLQWSCAPLPLGSGLVRTEHGRLPVPAPATVVLLRDMSVHDDGGSGERVTPTGAAILRSLLPSGNQQTRLRLPQGKLGRTGTGAGQRELPDRPNVLRMLLIEMAEPTLVAGGEVPLRSMVMPSAAGDADWNATLVADESVCKPSVAPGQVIDTVAQLSFDIDDMTPEELSVALDQIRSEAGVLDAHFHLALGKKGRAVFSVTVLCRPEEEAAVSARCLEETSTLGLRMQMLSRRTLSRELHEVEVDGDSMGIKAVVRPCGSASCKVESDSLAPLRGLQARRRHAYRLQRHFESLRGE